MQKIEGIKKYDCDNRKVILGTQEITYTTQHTLLGDENTTRY